MLFLQEVEPGILGKKNSLAVFGALRATPDTPDATAQVDFKLPP